MGHEDQMLQQAIQALEQGARAQARDLLTRLLRVDKGNPTYWLYLSAAVDSEQERIFCLERVLTLDPENEAARRGLILLGARAAGEDVAPVPPPTPPAWTAEPLREEEAPEASGARRAGWALMLGMALVVLGALFWGGYRLWDRYRPRTYPTPALLIYTTPDRTATAAARKPSQTPTPPHLAPGKPTPLWMLLPATYTPTPFFVNTPHPVEAYRLGLNAFARGQWQSAVNYMKQVIQASGGQAPDAYYYLGEAYTRLRRYAEAQKAYQKALTQDPQLAPAYLGLARLRLLIDPEASVQDLLDQAIEANPQFGEAYLERARYRLTHHKPEAALEDLEYAEDLLGPFPLVYLLQAQAYLALDDPQAARQAAQKAHADITLLPAYKALAQADLALGKYAQEAADLLSTYVQYQQDDAEAFYLLAQAYQAQGRLALALEAAQRAHELQPQWKDATLLYAQLLVEQDTPEQAQQAIDLLTPWLRWLKEDYGVNFWMGRAQFQKRHFGNAYLRFHTALQAAEPDTPAYYQALYWQAKSLTHLEQWDAAYRDWGILAEAPAEMVPSQWRAEARQKMRQIRTPTPGPTSTPTVTATATPTPTPEPSATP